MKLMKENEYEEVDWWLSPLDPPYLNPLDNNNNKFISVECMKSRAYHGSKPESRHQSVEAIDETRMKPPLVSETNWDACSDNIQ
jgi:hypothetical protein